MTHDHYDFDGNPISHWEWIALWGGERHVALTKVGDVEVSTIWLGLDHSFGLGGPPLIFETMIFAEDSELHEQCRRWPNKHAALAGHDQTVAQVRDLLAVKEVQDARTNATGHEGSG